MLKFTNTLIQGAFITLACISGFAATAQVKEQPISLQQAIDSALIHNRNLKMSGLDRDIALSKYRQTNAIYMPQLNFSMTGMATDNPLNVFGLKLGQGLVTQSDFDPARLNDPATRSDFMTRFSLQQPIYNPELFEQRKAAAAAAAASKWAGQRQEAFIRFETQKAFLQLQFTMDAENVMADGLHTATALYKFTKDRAEQGLLQQSDALNASVQVTGMETALAESKSSVLNASDYLGYLMGKTTRIRFQPTPATDQVNNNTINPVLNENRSDFKAMEQAIAASDLMISASRKSYLPRLNAFGSMQWNDKALAGFGAHSWLAGLNLSWDIFRGNSTRNKISTQILETQKLREQLNEQRDLGRLELEKTIRQLQDAKQRIIRDEAALNSAAEALRILQNRYEQGLVNSTDVLQAQSQITRLGLEKAQAIFTLRTTLAYLNFLSENNQ